MPFSISGFDIIRAIGPRRPGQGRRLRRDRRGYAATHPLRRVAGAGVPSHSSHYKNGRYATLHSDRFI